MKQIQQELLHFWRWGDFTDQHNAKIRKWPRILAQVMATFDVVVSVNSRNMKLLLVWKSGSLTVVHTCGAHGLPSSFVSAGHCSKQTFKN